MTIIHSIILGIVEGITEFLPISSTGHMIAAAELLRIPQTEFLKSFEIFIQLGAILAVVFYYRKTIFGSLTTWKKVIAAFIPTGILGLILYPFVKMYLLGNVAVVVLALIIGGIILIAFEMWHGKRRESIIAKYNTVAEVPYKQAVAIGTAQVLAVIPGVSRSATTIISGELMSLSRKAVVEFSFLLAIPTMAAATGLDLMKTAWRFSSSEISMLAVGFIVSFLVALIVIKWLLKYVERHSFIAFGMYRILAGLILFYILI